MEHRIVGTSVPVLELTLQPGETVLAGRGETGWISMAIQLGASSRVGDQRGGVRGALGRARGEAGLLTTEYTAAAGVGMVAFCARLPGRILPLVLPPDRGYLIHRHGLVCATPEVQVRLGPHRRLGAGRSGLQMVRVSGSGTAFVELHGEVVDYELPPGNMLRVDPGHVGMFEDRLEFDVAEVPGVPDTRSGGLGLHLATLTGPGRVWLQSMYPGRLGQEEAELGPTGADGWWRGRRPTGS